MSLVLLVGSFCLWGIKEGVQCVPMDHGTMMISYNLKYRWPGHTQISELVELHASKHSKFPEACAIVSIIPGPSVTIRTTVFDNVWP